MRTMLRDSETVTKTEAESQLLSEWIGSYKAENIGFSSIALHVEVQLREARIYAMGLSAPSTFVTAVAADGVFRRPSGSDGEE